MIDGMRFVDAQGTGVMYSHTFPCRFVMPRLIGDNRQAPCGAEAHSDAMQRKRVSFNAKQCYQSCACSTNMTNYEVISREQIPSTDDISPAKSTGCPSRNLQKKQNVLVTRDC